MAIAWIDPSLVYVTMQKLGQLNAKLIAQQTSIITANGQPVAVMVPYQAYLELQELMELPKSKGAGA
jgi:prevent-host-death family protein